jgi:ribosome-associated toxin RatA of RatAB toxin-antitoxin module
VHRTGILLVLLVTGAGADDWPVEPPRPNLDDAELARLEAGEVLVENDLEEESGGAATVHALFWAPTAAAWDVLGDCEVNYQFVDGLRDCELIESSETEALTRQAVKKHFLAPRMEYTFKTARQSGNWVAIRLVSGDLKRMEGSWRFDPVEGSDAVLVSHHIQVQPKMPVPRWLVRRTLKRDIGDMVACLRSIAAASGSEQQQADDSERCPRGQAPPGN